MDHYDLLSVLQDIADDLKSAKKWGDIDKLADRVQALHDKLDN